MAKNILIFSDGTGQAGGLRPDQRLSNVYKLFRATRTGPDSIIDPAQQIAFYETGLGSAEISGPAWLKPFTAIRKILGSALGAGLTNNVADCYEAILKVHEPGDQIFLFGFSRGAYTVRSLAGVMNLCGLPTKDADGKPLPRSGRSLRAIVNEAVHTVYEHGAGHPRAKYEEEREEQARRFRVKYQTEDDPVANVRGNIVPYFIGVFDTVAALGVTGIKRFALLAFAAAALAGGVIGLGWIISSILPLNFMNSIQFVGALSLIALLIFLYRTRVKVICDFPKAGDRNYHWAAWRFAFYDRFLDPRVRYARHAQAIDERRATFARVGWGRNEDMKKAPADWLVQKWFAGNHSDIGGSYPETESRLSDTALNWMAREAESIPNPLIIDWTKLNLFPDPLGMQHCEVESLRNLYPRWIPRKLRRSWDEKARPDISLADCHESVQTRFDRSPILNSGIEMLYQPECLRGDPKLARSYLMSSIIAYRYSDFDHADGEVLFPRGDSFGMLTDVEKPVELLIRKTLDDGESIRGNSLFAWRDEAVARRLYKLSGKKYLYVLEVYEAHVRFRGDLNHYNNAKDAVAGSVPFDSYVNEYCLGKESEFPGNPPRIELMISRAKVLNRLSAVASVSS